MYAGAQLALRAAKWVVHEACACERLRTGGANDVSTVRAARGPICTQLAHVANREGGVVCTRIAQQHLHARLQCRSLTKDCPGGVLTRGVRCSDELKLDMMAVVIAHT